MTNWTKRLVAVVMVLGLTSVSVWAAEADFGSGEALEDENYTLESMLQYALEDERMAQAEYAAIMEAFDVTRPFSNILQAEKQHEAALLALYEAKGLEVPEFDASQYITIPQTLDEVYTIGIQAEIDNIAMYDAFLEQELDEDVRLTFEALQRASESHLNAFRRASGEDMMLSTGNGRVNDGVRGFSGQEGQGHQGRGQGHMSWNDGQRMHDGSYHETCPYDADENYSVE